MAELIFNKNIHFSDLTEYTVYINGFFLAHALLYIYLPVAGLRKFKDIILKTVFPFPF